MKYLSQAGDTIVEVLIAISVVSLVLVAAYQTTRYNTRTGQDTQEHSQALKLAEAQVEYLRANGGLEVPPYRHKYSCFKDGAEAGLPFGTAADCVYEPLGSGTDPSYVIAITQAAAGSAYQVSITWTSLNGGNNNVSLLYRPPVVGP